MASETMTVQERTLNLIQDLRHYLPTPGEFPGETKIGLTQWGRLLAEVEAVEELLCTTAGSDDAKSITREQVLDEFRCGITDLPYYGRVLTDEMADEIIRLRTTAGTGAGGGRVTEAMVEAARAAFSREWYEDVEARPMRVALTAALAASARGNQ